MAFSFMPLVAENATGANKYKNSSAWGEISDVYKVRLRLCDKTGAPLDGESDQVIAIALDGNISIDNQYSTPFENSNPEQRLPTLMGMLQSGDWVNTLDIGLSNVFGIELGEDKKNSLNSLEGRTNLTKVNSTQIFVSTQPITIPMTLYLSAWRDANIEVEQQVSLLKQWALPQELSDGSILASALEDQNFMSLFPSTVPPYVSMYYGGKCFTPMLIQSVSEPLVVPMDSSGNRVALQVQIQLVSRTSWDKNNIKAIY